MKALAYTRPLEIGELSKELQMLDLPAPEPEKGQLLVRTRASSINIDDLHFAEGTFMGGLHPSRASGETPSIPGVDVAGTVEKLGPEVSGFAKGDEVLGIARSKPGKGTWAEYCCVGERWALKKPAGYSFEEASSCAIGGKTAANAVISANLSAGQTAVVVGASGGIGSIIVQVLHQQGVHVIGVCSKKNTDLVGSLGAGSVVDYARGPFGDQLAGTSVDAVIDCVGGRETEVQGMKILGKSGRFVTLVGPQQYVGETRTGMGGVMGMLWYMGRRALVSLVSGPRYVMAGMSSSLAPLQELVLQNGIKPPIDRKLPFEVEAVREGVAYVGSHRARGKVVITIAER
jgi:NADPH:quinone reductase-like Zn-dependent oxidoreductase